MIKLLLNMRTTEKRVAVLEREEVVELIVEQPGRDIFVGDILKGRITKVVPGLQAVFVDIGTEKSGYLHKNEIVSFDNKAHMNDDTDQNISQLVTEGSEIIVQVVKESFGTKGPKLTMNVTVTGDKIIYLPYGAHIGVSRKLEETERERLRQIGNLVCEGREGLILRTASQGISSEDLLKEMTVLRKKWREMNNNIKEKKAPTLVYQDSQFLSKVIRDFSTMEIEEIVVDDQATYQTVKGLTKHNSHLQSKILFYRNAQDLFSYYQVDRKLAKALDRTIWLKNGGTLMIENTEAMTIIDVNTTKFTGKQNLKETILQTNLQAAKEIAKQIRLRNCSGMIIIDFISMDNDEHRLLVEKELLRAFQNDRNKVHAFGFTELGLYQLTRKKIREPIRVELLEKCPICNGSGELPSTSTITYKIEREIYQYKGTEAIWIEVANEIAMLLHANQDQLLEEWKQRLNMELFISTHNGNKQDYYLRHVGDLSSVKARFTSS